MKRYMLLFLSVVLVVFSSTTSFASYTPQDLEVNESETFIEQMAGYTDQFEGVSSSEEQVLLNTLNQNNEDGFIKLNSEGELDIQNASVYKQIDSGEYTIRVPFVQGKYEKMSGITVVYDGDKNFKYFLETIMYENDGTGNLLVWKNNELQNEVSLGIAELEDIADNEIGLASTYQCLTDCLSSQGVPLWVLGAIGVACSAICVATGGLGCVVCIQSLGLGYVQVFDYCLNNVCTNW